MPALRVEPPAELIHYDNLDFTAVGSIRQDMTTILAWRITIDGVKYIRIMRFTEAGNPMWLQPITLPTNDNYSLESSSDAFFVVTEAYGYTMVYKYSLAGTPIWSASGVELHMTNYANKYEVSIYPDNNGGIWLVSNTQNQALLWHNVDVQRLDANGNTIPINEDNNYWGDYECYFRDAVILEDNSIIISIALRNENTLVRIASDGTQLFRGSFANTYPALEYSSLDVLSETKVMYAVGRKNCVDVYTFNVDGTTYLQNSFSISLDEDAAIYVEVVALSESEAAICTMNYAKSTLLITSISESGDVHYQRTMHDYSNNPRLRYTLHSAGNSECYIVYNNGYDSLDLQLDKISSSGVTIWEKAINSAENYSGKQPDYLADCLSGVMKVYWMDYRFDSSGISHQAFNASGSQLFPDAGVPLVTGSRGFIVDSNILSMGNSSIAVTLRKKDAWAYSTLHLDMIEPSPDNSWPANGIDIASDKYIAAMKTIKAGDDILVLWQEGYPEFSPHLLNAQLVSANGQTMWGPEGITVYSEGIRSFFGANVDGSIFIAWQTLAGDAYCQKVMGGLLTGPRICLFKNQEGRDPDILSEFTGGYVVLSGYNQTRVLRVSSDGNILPSFSNQGLLVSSDYCSYLSAKCMESHLVLNYKPSSSISAPVRTVVISPNADILLGCESQNTYAYFRSCLKSGYLYFANYDNGLEISKYSMASDCLWTKQIPFHVPSQGFINGAIEVLTDSTFVLLFYTDTTSYTMHYYVFDAHGNSSMTNPEVIFDSPSMFSRNYAITDAGIFTLYRDYENQQWLKLQKISVESQEQPGEGLTPLPQVVFGYPYPNPFKDSATIQLYLKDSSFSKVTVYNLKGQLVNNLYSGVLPSGHIKITWDGNDSKGLECASGIYFVRLEAHGRVAQTRLIKLN
jgi:hypothetical protein